MVDGCLVSSRGAAPEGGSQVTAAALANPNFTGSDDADPLARIVLAHEFERHGLVPGVLEESLASEWERLHRRACVRTWEELPENRATYEERKALFAAVPPPTQPRLVMDPEVARQEITRLERSANPAEYADRINELRTEVLGEAPQPYGEEALVDPLFRSVTLNREESRWQMFLAMPVNDKFKAIEAETDIEFLDKALHGPQKHVPPHVRKAIKDRIATLKEG